MKPDPAAVRPLTSACIHILLALAGEDLHGYGIMLEISRQTEGGYKLGPGTLYDNLQRLMDQQLVQEAGQRSGEDPRRRYYKLTPLGRGVLSAEITRLEGIVRAAKPLLKPREGMMIRRVYAVLLRWHPPRFRERFGDEMQAIFDESSRAGRIHMLFCDVIVSLVRQWMQYPSALSAERAAASIAVPPVFHLLEDHRVRRSAILNGVVISVAMFGVFALMLGRSSYTAGVLIGTRHQSPRLLPVAKDFIEPTHATAEIRLKNNAEDPWRRLAALYFSGMPLLRSLDRDHDLILSPDEIANAPAVLGKSDSDGDGALNAAECGLITLVQSKKNSLASRKAEETIGLRYFQANPVLAALDTSHDGRISAEEISASPAALRNLDINGDGSLSPIETIPEPIPSEVFAYVFKLDRNRDGVLSLSERAYAPEPVLTDLLRRADRDHDGIVTVQEIAAAIRLRQELERMSAPSGGLRTR